MSDEGYQERGTGPEKSCILYFSLPIVSWGTVNKPFSYRILSPAVARRIIICCTICMCAPVVCSLALFSFFFKFYFPFLSFYNLFYVYYCTNFIINKYLSTRRQLAVKHHLAVPSSTLSPTSGLRQSTTTPVTSVTLCSFTALVHDVVASTTATAASLTSSSAL